MKHSKKHSKASAGRMGGLATVARYGRDYMRDIGRRGAQVFHQRYALVPEGTSNYAIVERATGERVGRLYNPPMTRRLE